MDINALRVFNALHSLSISEEEFALIEGEQGHTERTGLYIGCVKKGHSICVGHDENHKIIIKKIKSSFPTPCRVLFKTVITFDDLLPEVYTLHSIAQYRTSDDEIKHRADNLEELKDRICDRFVDNNPKSLGGACDCGGGIYSARFSNDETKRTEWENMKSHLVDSQLKALFWLFNEDYEKFGKEVKVSRDNIARIIKVFERNNRRLAIIQRTDNYQQKHTGGCFGYAAWDETVQGSELMIRCFRPKDPQYNFVDTNREIYLPMGLSEDTEIWLDDALFEKIGYHELKVLSKRLFAEDDTHGNHWILLNADEYNKKQSLIRIEAMSAARKDQDEKAQEGESGPAGNNIYKEQHRMRGH